jgi:hypothetical protein
MATRIRLSRKMTRYASAQYLLWDRHRHVLPGSPASSLPRPVWDSEAKFDIATLELIEGSLPPRADRLVRDWAELHRAELAADWSLAIKRLPLKPIEPLPSDVGMVAVTSVEVLEDYRLRLAFADGTRRVIDLSNELSGPIFEPLRNPSLFRQVRIDPELGTIVWPNGADIAPEALYTWILEPPGDSPKAVTG